MAALQGMHEVVQETRAQLGQKEAEIKELSAQLHSVLRRLAALEAQIDEE